MISIDYIQKGMLFSEPKLPTDVPALISSFSATLEIFFLLAGRLSTVHHPTTPPSLSMDLQCNNKGANFIHASAPDVAAADILTLIIPTIVSSFFPLNGCIGIDGHSSPLLAVQVTELADAVFIAGSLSHTVADAASFWHFINTWSEIARSGRSASHSPVLDRRFLDTSLPISIPYSSHDKFIERPVCTRVSECFFNFSAKSIANLKAKANSELGTSARRISSLQALLAHTWRSVTRARGLEPDTETIYVMMMGCRSRLTPPLPPAYLGNAVLGVPAKTTVEELLGKGLGWAASLLNEAIALQTEKAIRNAVEKWSENPSFMYMSALGGSRDLSTGSSPRFDMYGNDFGWGRPIAVRSGCANKFDGKVTLYPGIEVASMGLEVSLSPEAMAVLPEDDAFMDAVDYKR